MTDLAAGHRTAALLVPFTTTAADPPYPRDGRYTNAILTDAGCAYLVDAAPGHAGRVLDLFIDVLTPGELQT